MNSLFKLLLKLADTDQTSALSIFAIGGHEVSRSKLQSWTVSEANKKYRPITLPAITAFLRGLKSSESQKYRSRVLGPEEIEDLETIEILISEQDIQQALIVVQSLLEKKHE